MATEYKLCVAIDTREYTLSLLAFWKDKPQDHEMSSGYLLEYKRKDKPSISWSAECLDNDHVWRELTARNVRKHIRKFIIKFC